jgi:hypothetical protein
MFKVTSERLAIGLVFVVIGTLACLAPTQSDTWWLLRAGHETFATHTVSLADTYSFTATGLFWPNHEWLTEVIFYALYAIGRMPLVTLFCAAVILGTWGLSWSLTEGAFEIRFLVFAVCLVPAAESWAIRPQVFSMALFMVTTVLVLRDRIAWLPLVMLVWTNLHGAVALGLAAVIAALCADVVARRRIRWPMVLMVIACVLVTFISPLGARLWSFIPASMERSRINQLIEWQAPGASPGLWPFWVVAAALPIATVLWWRRLDERTLKLVAIAFAILPLALTSIRNVAVFLLVAVPAITALARPRDRVERIRKAAGEHVVVNATILGVAVVAGAAVVVLAWLAPAPSLGWRPIGPRAAQAIAACGRPLYNTYGDGGVLIWFVPEQKVFIDNRQDPYPTDLLKANHQLELDGQYAEIFAKYDIQCAVAPPTSPIADALNKDPAWTRQYVDDRWTVFHRKTVPLSAAAHSQSVVQV